MPNSKNKNQPLANPFRRRHPRIFLLLLVVVVVAVAGAATYGVWRYENNKAIAADRARFEQADKDVQAVVAAIQKAYPPQKQTYTRSCKYLSRDYDPRPINCSVGFGFSYGAPTIQDANVLVGEVSGVVSSSASSSSIREDFSNGHEGVSGSPFLEQQIPENKELTGAKSYRNEVGLSCPLGYDLINSSAPPDYYRSWVAREKYTIIFTLSCYGPAHALLYPIEQ